MEKSIALIGGGGFIGTNLVNYFSDQDYNIIVIGRSVTENSHTKNKNNSKIKRVLIDVNMTSKLIQALEGYENIIWLVNDLVPGISMDSLVDDFTFNISPLIHFLESIDKLEYLKNFVFVSSGGTIYGDPPDKRLLNEASVKKPISAYGLSKIIAENYISYITERSTFKSIILRPSNVYGNYQNFKKPQGVVGYAFNALLNDREIDLFGEGKVIRDFIHVLDLAEAVKLSIENQFLEKVEIFNVGSQEGYSIREILNFVEIIANTKIKTIARDARNFDCEFNILDTSKIRNKLDWSPKINIIDGLQSVWDWLNKK